MRSKRNVEIRAEEKRGAAAREKEEKKRESEGERICSDFWCVKYINSTRFFFRVGRVKVVHEIRSERGKSREEYLVNHARNHSQGWR